MSGWASHIEPPKGHPTRESMHIGLEVVNQAATPSLHNRASGFPPEPRQCAG